MVCRNDHCERDGGRGCHTMPAPCYSALPAHDRHCARLIVVCCKLLSLPCFARCLCHTCMCLFSDACELVVHGDE